MSYEKPSVDELPSLDSTYRLWHAALGSRIRLAEWAIHSKEVGEKVEVQQELSRYSASCPYAFSTLTDIARGLIIAIDITNTQKALEGLRNNEKKYEDITQVIDHVGG